MNEEKDLKISFDYSSLKGKIVEKYGSYSKFAKAFGWSRAWMSKKLNNNESFKIAEIKKMSVLLEIEPKQIPQYFFKVKV